MLRPEPNQEIPEETIRVARAAFPKGNVYMQMRDALGMLYEDEAFRGKTAHYTVSVHDVKETQLPELTDDFAQAVSQFLSIRAAGRSARPWTRLP